KERNMKDGREQLRIRDVICGFGFLVVDAPIITMPMEPTTRLCGVFTLGEHRAVVAHRVSASPRATLHMQSSAHGRTSRRSQVCAVHSVLSTATSTRLARPWGSAPTPAVVPATSLPRSCRGVYPMLASRYRTTRTTRKAAWGYECQVNKQTALVSRGRVEEGVA
ncbi:hypothetical protein EDB85DRAFT_1934346, partial [Lactarius pseudohatsudake]